MSKERKSPYNSYREKLIEKHKDLDELPRQIQQRINTIRQLPSDHDRLGEQVFMLLFDTSKMLWRYNNFFKKHPFHFDDNVENFNTALEQVRHFGFTQHNAALRQFIANFPENKASLCGLESTYHYVRQAQIDEHFSETQRESFRDFFDQIRTRFNAIYKTLEEKQGKQAWLEYNKKQNKPFKLFDLGQSLAHVAQNQNAHAQSEFERMTFVRDADSDDAAPFDDLIDYPIEPLQQGEDAVVWMWHKAGIFSATAYYEPVNHIPEINRHWRKFNTHHKAEIKKRLLGLNTQENPNAVAQVLPDIAHWMIKGEELKTLSKKHLHPLLDNPIKHQAILVRAWKARLLTTDQQQTLASYAYDLYTKENSGAPNLVRQSKALRYCLFYHYRFHPDLSLWEFYYSEQNEKYSMSDEIATALFQPMVSEILQTLLEDTGVKILEFYRGDISKHNVIKKVVLSSVECFEKMVSDAQPTDIESLTNDETFVKTTQQQNHPVTLWLKANSLFKNQDKTGDTKLKSSPEFLKSQATLRSQTPEGELLTM